MPDPHPDRAAMEAALRQAAARHEPVLLSQVVAALAPERGGVYLDGTFGAGGYARAVLDAGATKLIGLDRDRTALADAQVWTPLFGDRLHLVEGCFSALDSHAAEAGAPLLDGVALDIGVSSMQIDTPERGFSFLRDGPLDMRMSADDEAVESAAELIARLDEAELANVIFHYGEERASRRIARAIVAAREEEPIETTARLAEIVENAVGGRFGGGRSGRTHPATRVFQALRIAVNDELGELIRGLGAAERALSPGGVLVVVTFHSLEDRIVKRFFAERFGGGAGGSRHTPEINLAPPSFEPTQSVGRKALTADEEEAERNPRARSAKLRAGRRTEAPPQAIDAAQLGAPRLVAKGETAPAPRRRRR